MKFGPTKPIAYTKGKCVSYNYNIMFIKTAKDIVFIEFDETVSENKHFLIGRAFQSISL